MAAWVKPTRDDLTATLNATEQDAYSASSSASGDDPIEKLLLNTVRLVRGFVQASGTRLSKDESLIPASLLSPTMDYAAFDILKRIDIPISEDRRKARTDALAIFNRVADGHMAVEPPDDIGEEESATALPSFVTADPERRLV